MVNKIVESFKGIALEAKLVFPNGEFEQENIPAVADIRSFIEFSMKEWVIVGEKVIVVETKSDGDDSDENKAKYRAAKRHFMLLNDELAQQGINEKYYFCFLSPIDYNAFAQYIIDGRMFTSNFRSKLDDLLEQPNK